MDVPTSDLQDFFEIHMQLKNEKIKINLNIRNYFNKFITFTQNNLYPSRFLTKLNFFVALEMLNGRLQNLF